MLGIKLSGVAVLAYVGLMMAESAPSLTGMIPSELGLAGTSLLGVLVYWLLWHQIPDMNKKAAEKEVQLERILNAHLNAEKEGRSVFVQAIKDEAARHSEERTEDHERLVQLLGLPSFRDSVSWDTRKAAAEAMSNAAMAAHTGTVHQD